MDIKTLSQQLNMPVKELRIKMREAGFEVSERARKIDNELAKEITKALSEDIEEEEQDQDKALIKISEFITVKDFAEKLRKPVAEVMKKLIESGVMATINEEIDADTAAIIGHEFGVEVEVEKAAEEEGRLGLSFIEQVLADEKEENLTERSPIVAVMGHVDHGKTTLLDTIRKTEVAAAEAGAITQHIGAYQVEHRNKKITFLDTPGHEAFAAMRARGANVTDIIVLVVAADDSVKPQTVEVINRAKLTKTPLVIAINKMDKPEAQPEKVKADLAELGVTIEEWGGKTPAVSISAKTGDGIEELLEVILLLAEVEELKANPEGKTVGVALESHVSRGQGPVATVLIQNGTLRVGEPVAAGIASGKVRTMEDPLGQKVKSAGPATPVRISGLADVCETGDIVQVPESLEEAKQLAAREQKKERAKKLKSSKAMLVDKQDQELNLILRADVRGSLEAVAEALAKLENEDVKLKLVDQKVGDISESDVLLAENTGSTIVGFNVKVGAAASKLASRKDVSIQLYDVIYELVEDVTQALLEMMPVEVEEKVLGRAKVKAVFRTEKKTQIIGGEVAEGKLVDKKKFRIHRGEEVVGSGKISELQQNKVEVDEVRQGKEFGAKVEMDTVIEVGDVLEIFDEIVKKKTLES